LRQIADLIEHPGQVVGAKPAVIRSDNGPEFVGKAMLNWAHRNGTRCCHIASRNFVTGCLTRDVTGGVLLALFQAASKSQSGSAV
jgi:hypothetical protein